MLLCWVSLCRMLFMLCDTTMCLLSDIMLSFAMQSVIMLSILTLSVIMLSVIMLSVLASEKERELNLEIEIFKQTKKMFYLNPKQEVFWEHTFMEPLYYVMWLTAVLSNTILSTTVWPTAISSITRLSTAILSIVFLSITIFFH